MGVLGSVSQCPWGRLLLVGWKKEGFYSYCASNLSKVVFAEHSIRSFSKSCSGAKVSTYTLKGLFNTRADLRLNLVWLDGAQLEEICKQSYLFEVIYLLSIAPYLTYICALNTDFTKEVFFFLRLLYFRSLIHLQYLYCQKDLQHVWPSSG